MTKTFRPLANLRRVYCAGPLFNEAERREMLAIAHALRQGGFETFLPHADGFEFSNVLPYLVEQGHAPAFAAHCLHAAIFAMDTYQVLLGCGSLVFNMNGRAPDEGGVAEMSMAWTWGKPLVIYKEDVRSALAGRDNPLVVGQADFQTVRSLNQLAGALSERIASLEIDADFEVVCPPALGRVLSRGELLWSRLQSLGEARPAAIIGDWVLEMFQAPSASRLSKRA